MTLRGAIENAHLNLQSAVRVSGGQFLELALEQLTAVVYAMDEGKELDDEIL